MLKECRADVDDGGTDRIKNNIVMKEPIIVIERNRDAA